MENYVRPSFLPENVETERYIRWLDRKATAHFRRDGKRGNFYYPTRVEYKVAIHEAVLACKGFDAYTGEPLDWTIISNFRNESAKADKRKYKMLPTVDHKSDGSFCICAWRTNDAKNDLDLAEFLALCKAVLQYHGYAVQGGNKLQDTST